MVYRLILTCLIGAALLLASIAGTHAQIEDQLSAYTGENAKGYMQPLNDALGASLNNGFYYSARIPESGFRLSVEFVGVAIKFDDADRVFNAVAESPFQPVDGEPSSIDAPTIIGNGEAVLIDGLNGTSFAFPGGLDLNGFGLVIPQIRFGNVKGTEGLLRIVKGLDIGDSELGKIDLLGIGLRHSLSQYFADPALDLAAGGLWQTFKIGENSENGDLVDTNAFSLGVQASKALPMGSVGIEPYAGLSYDSFKMKMEYKSGEDLLEVDFDRSGTVHFAVGAGFNFYIGQIWAQYDWAQVNGFSLGLALGNIAF
jgi:hypothetical protein